MAEVDQMLPTTFGPLRRQQNGSAMLLKENKALKFERSASDRSDASTINFSPAGRLGSCIRLCSSEWHTEIEVSPSDEARVSATALGASQEEHRSSQPADMACRRYSMSFLLDLRKRESHINPADIDKEVLEKKNFVAFRTPENAKANDVVFTFDRDVDVRCIVDASNLGIGVEWFRLKTFCEKKCGVAPLAIRMCKRQTNPSAMIVFETVEQAATCQQNAANLRDVFLKGKVPRFQQRKRDADTC